jgi:hypothetical protein
VNHLWVPRSQKPEQGRDSAMCLAPGEVNAVGHQGGALNLPYTVSLSGDRRAAVGL